MDEERIHATMRDTLERIRRGLQGRYELDQAVGQGATATVYRARDLKHDRAVAIKVLRPEVSLHMTAARFLKEIGIAARLAHPHILPLHDSGAIEHLLYYVTPFVEGASLQDRLRAKGPLPIREVIGLGAEIAGALAYAHAQDVVHRDIKPANILLAEEHAVVCDFGVARAKWSAVTDVTATGMVVGTPLYMSPEQAMAGSTIDGRADVYSLGCVLYEAIVGGAPFAGLPPRALLARKAVERPPSLSERDHAVPPELARLVDRMLSPDAADRPGARECARALEAIRAGPATPPLYDAAARAWWMPTDRAVIGAAVGLVAVVTTLVAIARPWSSPSPELVPDRVIVGLFDNRSGDPGLDHLGDMAVDWITHGLQLARFADVVPTPTALSASRYVASGGDDPLRQLAEETRAGIVVSGSYYLFADSIRFHVQITHLDGGSPIAPLEAVAGPVREAETVIDRVRQRVAGSLAASFDHRLAETLGPEARPPTYEAYRSFMEGMDLYIRNEPKDAIPRFRRAFEQDSTFLASLLFLALNHSNLGEWAAADSILHQVMSRRSELTRYHQFWLDYRLSLLSGDRSAALRAIRRASEIAPGSKATYNYAYEAFGNGKPREALAALSSLEPERGDMRGWLPYWWLLADVHHSLGQFKIEGQVGRQAAELYPHRLVPIALQTRAAAATGDARAVQELLRGADRLRQEEQGPSLGRAYVESADERHAHGHVDSARPMLEQAVAWYEALSAGRAIEPRATWELVRALYRLERFDEALTLVEDLVAEHPDNSDYRGMLGLISVALGDDRAAASAWDWLEARGAAPYEFGLPQAYQARIAALRGQWELALDRLQEAIERGRGRGLWIHTIPEFGTLRASERFLELTSPDEGP